MQFPASLQDKVRAALAEANAAGGPPTQAHINGRKAIGRLLTQLRKAEGRTEVTSQTLHGTVQGLQRQLAAAQAELADAEAKIEEKDQTIADLKEQVARAHARLHPSVSDSDSSLGENNSSESVSATRSRLLTAVNAAGSFAASYLAEWEDVPQGEENLLPGGEDESEESDGLEDD